VSARSLAACALVCAGAVALADGGAIKPFSDGDTWMQTVTKDDGGQPLIHSLRNFALELVNRPRYRWRIGITWRFQHVTTTGMPTTEDRPTMLAIDDAIHSIFERDDAARIVYFSTGGGIREVMLYGTSDKTAWARVDALIKQFPKWFPGPRAKWAYVTEDAEWGAYRTLAKTLRP
jgi:uncharacterized protein DUF695